jgi:hypothetical protein
VALPPVARQRQAHWRPGGRVMFFWAFSISGPAGRPGWLGGFVGLLYTSGSSGISGTECSYPNYPI